MSTVTVAEHKRAPAAAGKRGRTRASRIPSRETCSFTGSTGQSSTELRSHRRWCRSDVSAVILRAHRRHGTAGLGGWKQDRELVRLHWPDRSTAGFRRLDVRTLIGSRLAPPSPQTKLDSAIRSLREIYVGFRRRTASNLAFTIRSVSAADMFRLHQYPTTVKRQESADLGAPSRDGELLSTTTAVLDVEPEQVGKPDELAQLRIAEEVQRTKVGLPDLFPAKRLTPRLAFVTSHRSTRNSAAVLPTTAKYIAFVAQANNSSHPVRAAD